VACPPSVLIREPIDWLSTAFDERDALASEGQQVEGQIQHLKRSNRPCQANQALNTPDKQAPRHLGPSFPLGRLIGEDSFWWLGVIVRFFFEERSIVQEPPMMGNLLQLGRRSD
jgi:hypothetical protein